MDEVAKEKPILKGMAAKAGPNFDQKHKMNDENDPFEG